MRQFRWAGLAIALLFAARCDQRRPARNVILISIDTLRPDHLGCYGYARETSPNLDALCREGVVFTEAISHAPSTLPSHASIFTSLLPSHHGASVARSSALSEEAPTLAELLKAEGYRTAAFTGGIQLDPLFGLDRGFDVYTAVRPSAASAEVLRDPVDRFDHVVGMAIEWLAGEAREGEAPFFLFLHTYEVHHPYSPDEETLARFEPDYTGALPPDVTVELLQQINRGETRVDERDLQHVIATYDAEIRSVDDALGRLVEFLRSEEIYEDSLVIVTSDHGEEFGEHGMVGWHSHTLYDELLRVPFVLRLPEGREAGRVVDAQVRGIDVAPTILAELGMTPPEGFEGESVLPLLADDGSTLAPRLAVARKDVVVTEELPSVRTAEWKWIRGQLFHLGSDPGETTDVAAMNAEVAAAMREELRALVDGRPAAKANPVVPDAELLEKLRALGYLK